MAHADASSLASWILAETPPKPDEVTHLKLQKLLFYVWGALLGLDLAEGIEPVVFQAWKHGPVCVPVYERYKHLRGLPIPRESVVPDVLDERALDVARAVINIYGRMNAWQLRHETHIEEPWAKRFDGGRDVEIPNEELRAHFARKFGGGAVRFPERLMAGSSSLLDGLPTPTARTLVDLSRQATDILGK